MKTRFLLVAVVFSFLCSGLKAQVDVGDSLALVDLYNGTGGAGWKHHLNWLTKQPVSKWYGVTVSANRVVELVLAYNRLNNKLPSSFTNLSKLDILSLTGNELQGNLNPFVKLPLLVSLNLSFNQFNDTISALFCNLVSLSELVLNNNQLTGKIPDSIGKLTNMGDLDLANNQLTGSIPPSIDNMTAMYYLNLSYNNLTGVIPKSIGNLGNMSFMYLDHNQLSGAIPQSIGRFKNIDWLYLNNNQLRGSIPASIGNLSRVQMLYLNDNKLSDTIPASIGNMVNLLYFHLENNKLTGQIPSSIGNLTSVYYVYLDSNQLTGTIPESVGNLKGTYILNLSNNQLSGGIPDSVVNMTVLNELDLSHNQLTGSLPKNIGKLQQLTHLDASFNYLSDSANRVYHKGNMLRQPDVNIDYDNYTFNGLESLITVLPDLVYTNQAQTGIHHYQRKLAVSAGGTLSNNTYTWFRIGKGSGNVVVGDSTFIPTESGSYYCSVTNKVVTNLTLHTDTVTYITNPIVKNELTISISPNPAKGMISIYGVDGKSDAKITIADVSGYVWMKVISREKTSLQVNVSQLKAGNYLLTMNDGKDVKTVMFVKE